MNFPREPDPTDWIGHLIGDRQRYRLEKRLGEGGMADVFLAMDTLLGQQVALKLLKSTLVGSGELRKRFEREVGVCAALKSDHIVQVTDYGVTPVGHPFYVMEYLPGQTLGQLMRRHDQQISVEQTVSIISQVCEGLRLAHAGVTLWRDGATASQHVKVIHRDLKPDNIFLVPKAQGTWVKILDFGIAKIRKDSAENTNLTSMFIGTFHYAAPEQFGVEKDLDERADIYSLGVILYEMLSKTDPFGLGLNINLISEISWALAHTSKTPVPLLDQPGARHLSLELEAVVMRCLQKLPEQRFASVDELSWALQAAVGNRASGKTNAQQFTLNQNTNPQFQQRLGSRGQDNSSVETKIAEIYNSTQNVQLVAPRQREGKAKLRLLLVQATTVFVAALVSAGLAYYAYSSLRTAPFTTASYKKPNLDNPKSDAGRPPTQNNKLLLAQAQELANKNNFKDAIAEASKIQPESSFRQPAQQLIQQSSKKVLEQAEGRYKQSYSYKDLENAVDITKAIPKTSVNKNAEQTIKKWQTEWKNNENYLNSAQNALKEKKGQQAINTANKIRLFGQEVKRSSPYWQIKMKPIIEPAEKLIAAPPDNSPLNIPPSYSPPHYRKHYNTPRYIPPRPQTNHSGWTMQKL